MQKETNIRDTTKSKQMSTRMPSRDLSDEDTDTDTDTDTDKHINREKEKKTQT